MKKNYFLFCILFLIAANLYAAQFTITPTGSLTYSPAITTAVVGDTIHMGASGTHPCVEVDQATWNANGNTPLSGGFGLHSSSFDIKLANAGTIYFVCNVHHGSQMKGQINVTASGVAELALVNDLRFQVNPSRSGHLNVMNTLEKPGLLYIFNMLGKLQYLKSLNGDADQSIDVDLPSGSYLCRFILEGNWTRTEKLIITGQIN